MMTDEVQVQLEISFDGPALVDGRMNVRDLAPSMLSFGMLFESANTVLNGSNASVSINVRATSSSSFHILYEVIQSQGVTPSFQDLIATAADMKELIFGGGIGAIALFGLVKWIRGRKPKVEKVNDSLFKLTIDDETYELPLELLKLYQDAGVRKALNGIVQPIKEQGIEQFKVHENTQLLQSVSKNEVMAFDVPELQEPLLDITSRYAFSIVSLAFKEDNKWRLTDGSAIFSVSMNDAAFQSKVDNNEVAFAKGDVLVCDLRTIQWQVHDGVKTEYEVVKVHSHRHARQIPMFDLNIDNL